GGGRGGGRGGGAARGGDGERRSSANRAGRDSRREQRDDQRNDPDTPPHRGIEARLASSTAAWRRRRLPRTQPASARRIAATALGSTPCFSLKRFASALSAIASTSSSRVAPSRQAAASTARSTTSCVKPPSPPECGSGRDSHGFPRAYVEGAAKWFTSACAPTTHAPATIAASAARRASSRSSAAAAKAN